MQNNVEIKPRPRIGWGRVLDVLAIAVILFVAWKIFIAPRALKHENAAYPAPRVSYERLDGSRFSTAQASGHVLFLDFFASWCEPCRLEIPMVENYARRHPEVEVVPIDVGEPRAVAAAFAKRFHMGNVALDPTTSAQGLFQLEGFPTIVVIDPENRIRATWAGFNPAIALAMSNAERALR